MARLGVAFVVSITSLFSNSPCDAHCDAIVRILRYIKTARTEELLYEDRAYCAYTFADWEVTFRYCVLIRGSLVFERVRSEMWWVGLV